MYLNACQSATSLDTPASNLAHALVQAGVPRVLGMQFSVPEIVALRLSERFYDFLAQGNAPEESLWQARRALWADESLKAWAGQDVRPFAICVAALYVAASAPAFVFPEAPEVSETSGVVDAQPRADFDLQLEDAQRFRGREREMAMLGRLFAFGYATQAEIDAARSREGRDPDGARVIVIRGEGGLGKTTLARKAADRFAWRFPDGIIGISLEQLPGKDGVIGRIGKFLLGEAFDKLGEAEREKELLKALRDARVLIVLDNYETVQEKLDAGDATARALAQFFARCAGQADRTALLITSRERPSGFANLREVPLEGLETDAAREHFWDFAGAKPRRDENENLVAQIVERVEGHPLAVELLASLYAGGDVTLPDLQRGLETHLARAFAALKNDRHASLFACFDFSFQFLDDSAKQLFTRMRMFESPVFAQQAQAVFGDADAAQQLNTLRNKGLIRAFSAGDDDDTPIYHLHPTARWFAGQAGAPEDLAAAFGAAYGAVFSGVIGAAYVSFAGKTDLAAVNLARLQIPDLVRALQFLDGEQRAWRTRDLAYLLQQFGSTIQAKALLEEAIQANQASNAPGSDAATASLLFEQARIAVTHGDLDRAMQLYQHSLDIQEQLGDLQGKAATLHAQAGVFVTRGDLDRAMQLYQQSAAIDEQLGDLQGRASTLAMVAQLHFALDEKELALMALIESLQILLKMGATPNANTVANIIYGMKQKMGDAAFAALWKQVTGGGDLPDWLK